MRKKGKERRGVEKSETYEERDIESCDQRQTSQYEATVTTDYAQLGSIR